MVRFGPAARRWLGELPLALVLVAMVALAGVTLGRIYHGSLLTQLMLGAAIGAAMVSTALRRAPAWLVAPVSVLLMFGYLGWAVKVSATHAMVPGSVLELTTDALRNGIPRLLTALIPVEPQPDTVSVPVIAAWLAALTSAELALRAGWTLLGYLPSALLFVGALYVVGPNAQPAVWTTLAYATLAALGLAITGRSRRTRRIPAGHPTLRLRLAAGATVGLAAVVGLGALLGPAVADQIGKRPVDPRRYVQPPELDALDENPLIRLSGWALSPEQRLFDLRVSGAGGTEGGQGGQDEDRDDTDRDGTGRDGTDRDDTGRDDTGRDDTGRDDTKPTGPGDPTGLRIRLAVLSDYDGVTWRVGAKYRTAGRALPPTPTTGDAPARTIRQDITVADLTGRLLPAAATPRFVDGVRVAYDPDTGTLIRPEGLLPGVRYTVDSVAQPLEVNLLSSADVPAGPQVARLLALDEGVPEQMERLAKQLGADSGAPYDRAVAIEEFLAQHYRLVTDAPSGHAYPNLSFFLFGPRNGGAQRGTSEQFAASYAVLARLLGLPTRVVVGFQVPVDGGPVRASDALAWPEVLFEDIGWVPFNPLPQPNTTPRPVEDDFRPKPEKSTPPPSDAPTMSAAPTQSPSVVAATNDTADSGLSTGTVIALAVGAVMLATLGYAGAVPLLVRARRRRRLTDPDPVRQVAGAWLELIDALRLAGKPAAPHLAATEVVAHAQAVLRPAVARRPSPQDPPLPGPSVVDRPRSVQPPRNPPRANPPLRGASPLDVTGRSAAPHDDSVPLDTLLGLVNVTAFGGVGPEPALVRQAQRQALDFVQRLRAGQPWWRRLLWLLHPGPLRWHKSSGPSPWRR